MRGSPPLLRPHGVLAVVLALAANGGPSAQVPQQTTSSWYAELLDTYESGDGTSAVRQLLDADDQAIVVANAAMFKGFSDSLRRLRARSDRTLPWIRIVRRSRIRAARLAVLLHTEAAMGATRLEQGRTSLFLASRSIELLMGSREEYQEEGPVGDSAFALPQAGETRLPDDNLRRRGESEWQLIERFCRQWFLTVIPWLQGIGSLDDALEAAERGLDQWKDDAELLLARGSVLESDAASVIVDRSMAERIYPPARLRRWSDRLEAAADDFRRVQRVSPDLTEATLRLGRVRQLKRNMEDARAAYDGIRSDREAEPFLKYHALLFLGELEEQSGHPTAAGDAYRQAVALMPVAQAPLLALSRLNDAAGDTAAARAWLRRSLLVVSPERDDPWWDYFKGQWRLLPARLLDLRRIGGANRRGSRRDPGSNADLRGSHR